MKKLIFTILLSFIFITNIKALPLPLKVEADAAIVMNLNKNEIIYEKNPDKVEILASLTKIMTAYAVIENVPNLNKTVTIAERDIKDLYGFTCIGLKVGDKVTYYDLLYALMLTSAADAAQTLAYHTSGSLEKFNKLMNDEAKKLNLRQTNFEDSYGGHDDNKSTPREMARLLKVALENKTFKKIFTTTYYTINKDLRAVNYTKSVATFHGLDPELLTGNKSGFTPEAGLLLASTAYVNGVEYAVLVFKCPVNPYMSTHILDTYKILDYLKTVKFKEQTLLEKGTLLKKIKVENSTINEYTITSDKEIKATLPVGYENQVKYTYHIADAISPLNKVGDNLGYVEISIGDEVIDRYHVYLKDEIYSPKKENNILIFLVLGLIIFALILLCTNLVTFDYNPKKL